MNLDARDQRRLVGRVEHLRGFARGFLDLTGIGGAKMELAVPGDEFCRHFDPLIHHVAMDFDVSWALIGHTA